MKAIGMVQPMEIHYIDHVAPICDIMQIPLCFSHEPDFRLAQTYYPWVTSKLVSRLQLSWSYLVASYDVLFISGPIHRAKFKSFTQSFEKAWHKCLRYVHCPHGFSDKILYMSQSAFEDITLIYGQNHLDQLKEMEVEHLLHSYVVTGNYRRYYYMKHREFFDSFVKEKFLKNLDPSRSTILYAPSWKDYDNATTFYDLVEDILKKLPDDYNFLIKPHPRLKIDAPSLFMNALAEGIKRKNVVLIEDFPLVYPLLAATDIYLGDVSSIGYDFLMFNRPMFFLNKLPRDPLTDRRLYLNRCGVTIGLENFKSIFNIIDQNLRGDKKRFGDIRKEVYDYTFGKRRSFSQIKKDIQAACNTQKAWRNGSVVPTKPVSENPS